MRLHRVDRSDLLLALRLVGLLVVRGRIDKRIDGLRRKLLPHLVQLADEAIVGNLVLLSAPLLFVSVGSVSSIKYRRSMIRDIGNCNGQNRYDKTSMTNGVRQPEFGNSPEDQVGSRITDKGDLTIGSLDDPSHFQVILLRLRDLERRSFLPSRTQTGK